MSIYSIAEAKAHLTQLVRQAEEEGEVHLSRHGKQVAVLLSIREYQRLNHKQRDFGEILDDLFEQDICVEETDLFDRDRKSVTDRGFTF